MDGDEHASERMTKKSASAEEEAPKPLSGEISDMRSEAGFSAVDTDPFGGGIGHAAGTRPFGLGPGGGPCREKRTGVFASAEAQDQDE